MCLNYMDIVYFFAHSLFNSDIRDDRHEFMNENRQNTAGASGEDR